MLHHNDCEMMYYSPFFLHYIYDKYIEHKQQWKISDFEKNVYFAFGGMKLENKETLWAYKSFAYKNYFNGFMFKKTFPFRMTIVCRKTKNTNND